ncbi:MAG TPA: MFS transporter [Candidatus Sulfotelmatobacter sp.]|nr:MFS transporter [Candidatus Sulfotelmatobacter sp.]
MATPTKTSNTGGNAPFLVPTQVEESGPGTSVKVAAVAWLVAAVYYFFQYVLRSSPSVMLPQMSGAFGVSAVGMAGIVGLFYYGYAPFSLLAGAGLDRLGPRKVIPLAAAAAAIGALLFSLGGTTAGSIGRLLQGAGGAFAPVGAIYIASEYFPPSKAATLIGATQMFGMAGGAAGQFVVGPWIAGGLRWDTFWIGLGAAVLVISAILFALLPNPKPQTSAPEKKIMRGFYLVFKNPQSILCGLIAGLLFIPTTIFDMVWGVRYLQEAHGFDYASAVLRTSMVPLGWIIGCPLLGFISDRLGRRKPVIAGGAALLLVCLAWILFGSADAFPRYVLGLVAGIASGAAMLPYTVIKEANPPQFGGIATGVVNFLNFTFSALLGPVFGWLLHYFSGGATVMQHQHYQMAFAPLLIGVAVAIALTYFLNETGASARRKLST